MTTHTATATAATTAAATTDRPRRGRSLRRRLAAVAVSLAGGLALALVGAGTAHADGGLPNCIHGVYGSTAVQTWLPQNDPGTAGMVTNQWLYRWNGVSWVYTGVAVGARSYAGGVWMSGGVQVNQLTFLVRPGSGYYLVKQQVIQASGAQLTFWQPAYLNNPGAYYASWCQA